MADDQQQDDQQDDYTPEEREAFGNWVELGAKETDLQRFLDVGLSVRWERREPSGSAFVMALLRNPVPVLMREKVPHVHERSRVTTTILHHHRGLEKKVIVMTATVERDTGDVSLVIDKETRNSY
ncbi:MAG TPA: hypothetical protein VLA76_03095 [Candidatus Angelobacter sp.]|nr:hypothetical protein [Candidatus Angelobacter sp.]